MSPDMSQTITLPLWFFLLILLFAGVTFASHFLFPSVRWYFRRRAMKVIARLNERLARPIEPFKLARRYDMIQRLIYDPEVSKAIIEHAAQEGVPENVAFEQARRYAREIVPGFSATAYFTFAIRFARWLSRSLYRIRLGAFDRDALEAIDPDAAVVFVINHRSNMDYVLVTYLVARASALSYAVGEWARIWPFSPMIRSMGAYFIRRRSRGGLYRKVLARYVQLATQGGVTQAMFPEGGLSVTGRVMEPKLGLLSYMVDSWTPGGREVIFVPVALNYDRVLEDRFLIAADKSGVRRFRPPVGTVLRSVLGHIWQRVTFRFKKFGTASVGFGTPLRLSEIVATVQGQDVATAVAEELMNRIRAVVPVMPVPMVSRLLLEGISDRGALKVAMEGAIATFQAQGVTVPRRDARTATSDALEILIDRKLVRLSDGRLEITEGSRDVLAYYAASIAHHFHNGLQEAPMIEGDAATRRT